MMTLMVLMMGIRSMVEENEDDTNGSSDEHYAAMSDDLRYISIHRFEHLNLFSRNPYRMLRIDTTKTALSFALAMLGFSSLSAELFVNLAAPHTFAASVSTSHCQPRHPADGCVEGTKQTKS
jgi:hypothetical protein